MVWPESVRLAQVNDGVTDASRAGVFPGPRNTAGGKDRGFAVGAWSKMVSTSSRSRPRPKGRGSARNRRPATGSQVTARAVGAGDFLPMPRPCAVGREIPPPSTVARGFSLLNLLAARRATCRPGAVEGRK